MKREGKIAHRMPKLTCITTVYNDGPLLFTAINSVLGQSFTDFEYLIVNDGSDAETTQLLSQIDDPRVRIIWQSNDGLSSARNTALRHAKGEYVTFLDADDSRPDWSFAAIVELLQLHNPDVLFCRGILMGQRGNPHPFFDDQHFDKMFEQNESGVFNRSDANAEEVWSLAQLIEPQSANKVIRTDLLRAFGIGFPDTHFFEDVYFHTLVLAAAEKIAISDFPAFTYYKRYARSQITSTAGLRRYDVIAVSRLTLDHAARVRWMDAPLYRSAVFSSCMKLIEWCEHNVGYPYKKQYLEAATSMTQLLDKRYSEFKREDLLALGVRVPGVNYARDMAALL